MIYITGDTHGLLENLNRKGISKIKRRDVLIITGDFGFVWDNSEAELKNRRKLSRFRFPILFVEGCHDNYDLLKTFPVEERFGAPVRKIGKNIFQLLRGNVYTISEKKVFAFGGGESDEKEIYKESNCWWSDEEPSEEEATNAVNSLKSVGSAVDIIVTHDAPSNICELITGADPSLTNMVLEYISEHSRFSAWYFGKYHIDRKIPMNYIAVAEKVHKIENPKKKKR